MSVRIRFLGTGNALGDGGRSQACILVSSADGHLLLDIGASAMPMIRRTCDPATIDAIAVTHLHGDHFAGLPFFVMEAKYAPRRRPLVVAGPPSLEARFGQASEVLFDDFYRTLPFELSFLVLGAAPARLGPALVAALSVDHDPRSEPHGLRVWIGGKLVAYSGDARWSEKLPPVAEGADLFICEATYFSDPDPVHLSVAELADHRAELHCARIVTTHHGRGSIARLASSPFEHADDGTVLDL